MSNISHLIHKPTPKPVPSVSLGDGGTCNIGSDRFPFTVVVVNRGGKELHIRADSYKRTDSNDQSESQTYDITPNPDAGITVITWRKCGIYIRQGQSMSDSFRYRLGERRAYNDPGF